MDTDKLLNRFQFKPLEMGYKSMSTSMQLLQVLKTQLLLFFDELIHILPNEQDFIVIRFFIKDQVPISDVMDYIVKKLVPLESYVLNKDERFFLEHQVLFEDLRDQNTKVSYFKTMWENSQDEENKEVIWNWFKYFIQVGKKYQTLNV
jgi:hypothetical protein